MTREILQTKIQELKQERQSESARAGEMQQRFNEAVAHVHQLDGAIAALEQLVKDFPAE